MSEERRRYFRIEDEVLLTLRQIDSDGVDERIRDFWENEHAFSIRNNYNYQIEQHIADFHKLENKMPELARYLAVLEKQIDRITDLLLKDDSDETMETRAVNLSAQGASFYSELKPRADSLVELKLKLLPSGQRLVIIARVVLVGSDADPDRGGHKVSLDFEHMHEADREILIKHIHGKQMESLSSAKDN